MSYNPTVVTNVTQVTTSVAQRGFGDILIIGSHNQFFERVRQYGSLTAVAADFPENTEEYKAAVAAFSVEPKPISIKIGRRRCSSTLTPATPSNGKVYRVTVTAKDGTGTVSSTLTYTADNDDTLSDVGTALAAAINGVPGLASKLTATSSVGVVTITQDAVSADFTVSALENLTVGSLASSETAAQVYNAIVAENNEFFAFASTDRSSAFVTALAAVVAATKNSYWYQTNDVNALGVYSPTVTDYTAVIKQGGNGRAQGIYHHDMSLYVEVRAFCSQSSYQPGDVIYANHPLPGVPASKNGSGNLLTETEKANLKARGLNFMDYQYKITTLRPGINQGVGENSWIDNQIGADLIEARCNEAVYRTLINANGFKYGMSERGHAALESVIRSVLDGMKTNQSRERLLSKYEITIPRDKDLTFDKRASRKAEIAVKAYLQGAIQDAVINVTLTYEGL